MNKIEFTKRNFSQELLMEYPDSVFIDSNYNYDDAIIGVTNDGRIVYATLYMDAVIFSEDDENGYDYKDDYDNEDDYFDYVSEQVSMTRQDYSSTYYENSPIFCDDEDFLENTYILLKENERSSFKDETDEDENEE